jgi:hypothetical protein
MSRATVKAFGKAPAGIATGQCLCGKVRRNGPIATKGCVPCGSNWHEV